MTSDVDHLFESVSRMASGTSTPLRQAGRDCLPAPTRGVGAATAGGGAPAAAERDQPLSAEDLIARLTGRTHRRSAQSSQPRGSAESQNQQRDVAVAPNANQTTMVPFFRQSIVPEPIDLELLNLQGHSITLPGGRSGLILRFTLLDWDDIRLDRLMLRLKRSMTTEAEARISRLLLHDDWWAWRLQVTIYVGPRMAGAQQPAMAPSLQPATKPLGLIAAL
ncbi:unnamed protein product [Jaminaea pallidilutea]